MTSADFGPRVDEEFIGDGIYAPHDDLRILLRNQNQNIALGHAAYVALVDYARRIGMERLQSG